MLHHGIPKKPKKLFQTLKKGKNTFFHETKFMRRPSYGTVAWAPFGTASLVSGRTLGCTSEQAHCGTATAINQP